MPEPKPQDNQFTLAETIPSDRVYWETGEALRTATDITVFNNHGAIGDYVIGLGIWRGFQYARQVQGLAPAPTHLLVKPHLEDFFSPFRDHGVSVKPFEDPAYPLQHANETGSARPLHLDMTFTDESTCVMSHWKNNSQDLYMAGHLLSHLIYNFSGRRFGIGRMARYIERLTGLEKDSVPLSETIPLLHLPANADELFAGLVNRFNINPTRPQMSVITAASETMKQYSLAGYAEVIKLIKAAHPDMQFNIIYDPYAKDASNVYGQIQDQLERFELNQDGSGVNIVGVNAHENMALLARQQLVVGNDTGLLHVAAALNHNLPIVGVYSPFLSPREWIVEPNITSVHFTQAELNPYMPQGVNVPDEVIHLIPPNIIAEKALAALK